MNATFKNWAAKTLTDFDNREGVSLLDEGPEEQAAKVAERLAHFAKTTPLTPVIDAEVDLAGFGTAPLHFRHNGDGYLLLSEIADALGWPLHKAHRWVENMQSFNIRDQRQADEERGDGRLGYECMRDYVDLHVWAIADDPEAKPDAGGHRYSYVGEWLVARDRLPALMLASPWGQEFYNNTKDAFGHAMRRTMGDALKGIPTYTADGQPTGGSALEMFASDLTEEEALRRARRGPALDDEEGQK